MRALACAADQDAAARAFLLHQDVILPQQEPCDLDAIRARYAEADRRRVTACHSSFGRMAKSAKASAMISMPGSPEESNHDR